MLSQLYIKNIAVIKEATIDFSCGFNVFTGETGAGKTILISAINAVLGERTSRDIIRSGETSAQISAVFDDIPSTLYSILDEQGYPVEPGEGLLIWRSISEDGKTQCRINGQPATVSILKGISSHLINVHGQHDSQQLLSAEKHLGFIDSYGSFSAEFKAYQEEFLILKKLTEQIKDLGMNEAEKAHKLDLLKYQIDEIQSAELQGDEEDNLLSERKIMRNSERITLSLAAAQALINGDEEMEFKGVLEQLDNLSDSLQEVSAYVDGFTEMASTVSDFRYELQEYTQTISSTLNEMEYDPERIEYIEQRIDTINSLKRKYGSSISEILGFLEHAQQELDDIVFADDRLEKLEQERIESFTRAKKLAEELSLRRKKTAEEFISRIESELAFLDMSSVRFSAQFAEKPLGATGMDTFELFVSTNAGEEPKPLAKIASGGELSRIMLAMKNVTADRDEIGTLIFDEIDTGVSGRAAQKIGKKLKEASDGKQVICVTHLAQVAAFATNHLLISKSVQDGKTFTRIETLTGVERESELARIIGGDIITPATLEAAREILEKSV